MMPTPCALGLLDQREQPLGLALGQRRRRLVEDQHRQLGAEAPWRSPPSAARRATDRRRASRGFSGKPRRSRISTALPCMARLSRKGPLGQLGAEEEVLLHGQLRHQREFLEHRADAELAGLMHRGQRRSSRRGTGCAGARPIDAGDERNQCRFAGAVLAEQHMHLARPEIEIDAVEGDRRPGNASRCLRAGAGLGRSRHARAIPARARHSAADHGQLIFVAALTRR